MESYYIKKNNQKIDFNKLKEPYRSSFNRVKEDAESSGYGVVIGLKERDTYSSKGLSFWFRNIKTRATSEIFTLPKDLAKFNFDLKLALYSI